MKTSNHFIIVLVSIISLTLYGCRGAQNYRNGDISGKAAHHSSYDDSSLSRNVLPLLMPYNRIIDPAGQVIAFGDPGSENHSLDVASIPGTTIAAVEDRYGIVMIDTEKNQTIARWTYGSDSLYNGLMSTYSGILVRRSSNDIQVFWSAASKSSQRSYVLQAGWDGKALKITNSFEFKPEAPSPLALPNEIAIVTEGAKEFLYVVLNGNNKLVKVDMLTKELIYQTQTGVAPYGLAVADNKIFITNWGGPLPTDTINKETAGVPYGQAYINPGTGATSMGSVSVIEGSTGNVIKEIAVGLHPNDIVMSPDKKFVYVANGNSDEISVIDCSSLLVTESISVRLNSPGDGELGDTPNALEISPDGKTLYVANGLDNAIAVLTLGNKSSAGGNGRSTLDGFIPTEAYPGGIELIGSKLLVTNIEGEGSRTNSIDMIKPGVPSANSHGESEGGAYNSHRQRATVSVIPLPGKAQLAEYTQKVKQLNLIFRTDIARLKPRKNIAPRPMPERIGEPSVFKYVLYVIKENRTYDQVLGDMPEGKGMKSLCVFGEKVTPNEHQLARDYLLLDNYYVSGKSSADGHQWADAAMASDYVEKNVAGWFRSYPHVQEDALVYGDHGFIWNNAADHGKTVKVYGEACEVQYERSNWLTLYNNYINKIPFKFTNTTTISRVRPMLSQTFPAGVDVTITDQFRADAFINDLNELEKTPGGQLPNLMVMALGNDHTMGTRPDYPTPNAMTADNDLALGRIIEALSKSRFWDSTVVFITEDDSQAGWDHVSAYRTTGFVVSPYSRLQKTISTNYNQTCMIRSIEQILGLPPMNVIDATALPMFDCFTDRPTTFSFKAIPNKIPLNEMNPALSRLTGKDLHFARMSSRPEFDLIDRGNDDLMNRILWHYANGSKPYPWKLAGGNEDVSDR